MATRFRPFIAGILSAALALSAPALRANQPPTAQEREQYRRDGTLQERIRAARALGNHRVDPELAARAAARLAVLSVPGRQQGAAPTPPPAWSGMPTKGLVKMLVLLVDFSDYPHDETRNSVAKVQARIFGAGDTATVAPYESLRSYYQRASYNQLDLQGSVLGWYRPAYSRASMAQTTTARQNLIKEALNFYNQQGHDFAQYDNNGDGKIDYFAVIWSGPDNGWSNFWWGYQTSFGDAAYKLDGKSLGKYSWQWESRPVGGNFTPLVLIHETGHALGLPDYYDYDDAVGPRGGVGGLDMMAGNWGDHNCFSKFLLDWITPAVYTAAAGGVTQRASGTFPDAAILMPDAVPGNPFGEFFMVQHRRRVLNDIPYPTDGLLIWHVDSRLNAGGTNYLFNNSYTEHKLLRLMEADGLEEIERGLSANAGDFWTSGKSFGPQGVPNSSRYSGLWSWMGITSISAPGETMSFNVFTLPVDTTPPAGVPGTPIPAASPSGSGTLSFQWTAGSASDADSGIVGYHLQVGDAAGAANLFDGDVGPTFTRSFLRAGQDGKTYFARVRGMNGAGLFTNWSPSSTGLRVQFPEVSCTALDACNLRFTTPGDAPWTVQAAVSHAGGSAAQSPVLADLAESFLQTTVVGPGTLGFWWKVSSEANYDFLTFRIDGVAQPGALSGEVDWTQRSVAIPAGAHVLRWTYAKDEAVASGQDRAWVDHVSFSGGTAPSLLGLSPASGPPGTPVTISGAALTGATAVTFNGSAAAFYVDSDATAVATVPAGAGSGKVSVTTPGGSAQSPGVFTVISADPNGDGLADVLDLALLARAWGATPASPNWNAAADLNGDGRVDDADLALFLSAAGF